MRRAMIVVMTSGLLVSGAIGYFAGSSHLLTPSAAVAADDCMTFPQTGKAACGDFLKYWQDHGGLAQQGYPISDVFDEKSETDGITHKVQYFERAVFEAHPENQPPNNVLLSLLGSQKYKAKYGDKPPVAAPSSVSPTVPATSVPSASGIAVSGVAVVSLSYALPNTSGYDVGVAFTATNQKGAAVYNVAYRVTITGGGKTLFVSDGNDKLTLAANESRPVAYTNTSSIEGTRPDSAVVQFYSGSASGSPPVDQSLWAVTNANTACGSGTVQCKFTADVTWKGDATRRNLTLNVIAHRGTIDGPVIAVGRASASANTISPGDTVPVSNYLTGLDQPRKDGGAQLPSGSIAYQYYVESTTAT